MKIIPKGCMRIQINNSKAEKGNSHLQLWLTSATGLGIVSWMIKIRKKSPDGVLDPEKNLIIR